MAAKSAAVGVRSNCKNAQAFIHVRWRGSQLHVALSSSRLLQVELPAELYLLFGLDFGAANRAHVVVLQPLLYALRVEEVACVVRKWRDIVGPVGELLHADAALVDARPVELCAELTVHQGVDQAPRELVVS